VDLLMAALVFRGAVLLCTDSRAGAAAVTSHRTTANFHLMTKGVGGRRAEWATVL